MKPTAPIDIDCIPEKEYLSPEFKLKVKSESNGPIIYETSNPSVFTVDQDGVVTITGPGRAYVIVKQLETDTFNSNQIDRLIIVNKSKPLINLTGPSAIELGNTPISSRILQIQTIDGLIKNVFSLNTNILDVNKIFDNEYELVPIATGRGYVVISTNENYYFNSSSVYFSTEIISGPGLSKKFFVVNMNTFNKNFSHNALKNIDIFTSNIDPSIKSNNLEIKVNQPTKGYKYDIPIFNISAENFVKSVNNYNKEILCCSNQGSRNIFIEWDFSNVLIYDFFPYEGNTNDRPRINLFRSDGNYIDYISGGKTFLKIPQNSNQNDPNAFTYEKWGDRNTGIKNIELPKIGYLNDVPDSVYYGVDFFTQTGLPIPNLIPPISNWITGFSVPGEIRYQYRMTGSNNTTNYFSIKIPTI